jgi:hypothetical protein
VHRLQAVLEAYGGVMSKLPAFLVDQVPCTPPTSLVGYRSQQAPAMSSRLPCAVLVRGPRLHAAGDVLVRGPREVLPTHMQPATSQLNTWHLIKALMP